MFKQASGLYEFQEIMQNELFSNVVICSALDSDLGGSDSMTRICGILSSEL